MQLKLALAAMLVATPCAAQQQQVSPAEAALQINSIAGAMASTMMQQARVLDDLRKQIADRDAKIKELEGKAEPKKE